MSAGSRAVVAPAALRAEELLAQPGQRRLHVRLPGPVPGHLRLAQHEQHVDFLGRHRLQPVLVPGIMCFGVISATFTNLAMTLCIRRDSGILKRLRGTPLPTSAMLGGLLLNAVVVAAILVHADRRDGLALLQPGVPGPLAGPDRRRCSSARCRSASLGVAVSTLRPERRRRARHRERGAVPDPLRVRRVLPARATTRGWPTSATCSRSATS